MRSGAESSLRSRRIRRWIGDDASPIATPAAVAAAAAKDAPDAGAAAHRFNAAPDWERDEFARAAPPLRLVAHGLPPPGLSARHSIVFDRWPPPPTSPGSVPLPSSPGSLRARRPRSRSSASLPSPTSVSSSAAPFLSPPSSPASASLPPTRSPSTPSRPTSLLSSVLLPPHKFSQSVLSIPSHLSSCTSSSSVSESSVVSRAADRKVPLAAGSNANKRAESCPPPPPLYHHPARPWRYVSLAATFGPKKRRLIVRGIKLDDDRAVDGVQRWASGLGAVRRVTRAMDGALWIEFQDRRVAENVCCLQAQVLIPRVGRVILDWAESRHPG